MSLTKEFLDAVDNGRKTRVRIMLKDIMLVDPTLKTFDEMLIYAEKNMPDLYDAHDGEELIRNASAWNENYMNQQMVIVVTNFSKERIALLKKIVQNLYLNKIQMNDMEVNSNRSSSTCETNKGPTGVQIAGGIISVAGAGTLIGGIIGSSASVAILGGVALVGGIAMVSLGASKEA